jgi:DNA-binding NarL/FixJ family response regulator
MTDAEALCVLVLEDSPQDVFLLRAGLSKVAAHCELIHAERLADALSLLTEHKIDLILTDLNLPDSLGLDTVRALVEQAPHVPVVVLFGCRTPELVDELRAAGACGHLSKDLLNSPALGEAITNALQRKQPRE